MRDAGVFAPVRRSRLTRRRAPETFGFRTGGKPFSWGRQTRGHVGIGGDR